MTTTTLHTRGGPVEMPSATTMAYAALRVAEALGLDPMAQPVALVLASGALAPDDAVVADYAGQRVELALVRR